MANEDIRKMLKTRGIWQYEVAEKVGVGESRLSKLLRRELTSEWRDKVMSAVEEITEERLKCLKTGIGWSKSGGSS